MMRARMLDDILAERIMFLIAGSLGRLGRLETHVVPAEVLKAVADLAKTLRTHGWARGTLAGEKSGRKGGKRLGFSGHLRPPY